MHSSLVADIGGTNARFGLCSPTSSSDSELRISHQASLGCDRFECLEEAIDTYLQSINRPSLAYASVAIAAPVFDDRIRMTNLNWSFSRMELQQQLGVEKLEIINDAAAGVLASTCLPKSELTPVRTGRIRKDQVRVNIVPGTGMGVAAAMPFGNIWLPIQGEGGHVGFSAVEDEDFDIFRLIARDQGRVTPETVLSGPGMVNLYKALGRVRGYKLEDMSPEELTSLAIAGRDELCVQTIEKYCGLLASLAGDLVLQFGAHGGVFLSGKILRILGPELLQNGFTKQYCNKGKMHDEVEHVPVHLVGREFPGLLGAAVWLMHSVQPEKVLRQVVG
jgi:glucokinase